MSGSRNPVKALGGKPGWWFAVVKDETLPCVHQHWWMGKNTYFDPGVKPGLFNEWVDALKTKKRVILTNDILKENGRFKRTGYIAIYEIGNIKLDQTGLTFQFKKRLQDLS